MCSLFACGVTSAVLGAALVVVSCVVSFVVVPDIVDRMIIDEVALVNNTEALERFEEIPFPLSFKIRIFNITNPDAVLAGGVPALNEMGPYVYKLYNRREVEEMDGDIIKYRIRDMFEFDAEASYPHTEDDIVTVVNIPYHGILQMAEKLFPYLMIALSLALNSVFGDHNGPIMTTRVGDFLFDGIPICKNPGIIGGVACDQIRQIGADVKNLVEQEDGSLIFTVVDYKQDNPSEIYEVFRGIEDRSKLGIIKSYNGSSYVDYWVPQRNEAGDTYPGICNMINGTDSAIFPPFVDRDESKYALNLDICRSVELRYQYDTEYNGIPVARFAAHEWFLDNDEGCFCLNVTGGITRENGCLLKGAMELYSCVGALLVLSYPHFLFADFAYRNGVLGMHPNLEEHRIYADLDPYTGTVVRGYKRAQFNIFIRPVTSISATNNLRLTLTPAFWVEEGMSLPDEYADIIKNRLLRSLNLLSIFIPLIISLCAILTVVGLVVIVWSKRRERTDVVATSS
ncbi:sensory neuron membrane protein 2-like [Zerene cesonia]|uniref:sensory neuron membrane protein 2-like n=1 Tax=Zerene cesonia TaxID=33412 RepID=UPI0018E50B51|nr:sensory neuron membrane protein 2-like [Zerene cesonia]